MPFAPPVLTHASEDTSVWIRRAAARSLTEQEQQSWRLALETFQAPIRVGSGHLDLQGAQVVVAWIDHYVLAVDEHRQIWSFCLEQTPDASGALDLIAQAYRAHRSDPSQRATPAPWPLRVERAIALPTEVSDVFNLPFRQPWEGLPRRAPWLDVAPDWRRVAAQWVQTDWAALLSLAGIHDEHAVHGIPVLEQRLYTRLPETYPGQSNELNQWGLKQVAQHLRVIRAALAPLRKALPLPVRHALWRHRHTDGALAHWLMGQGPQGMRYRAQALHAHPVFLPLALHIGGQWPHAVADASMQAAIEPAVVAGGRLSHAIDHGQPWEAPLSALFELNRGESRLLSSPDESPWRPLEHPRNRNLFTPAMIHGALTTAKSPPYHTVPLFLQRSEYTPHHLFQILPSVLALSPQRRPKTARALQFLQHTTDRLMHILAMHPEGVDPWAWQTQHLEPFFKGLPEDLDHPTYATIAERLTLLRDTCTWLGSTDDSSPWTEHTLGRLSWIQWNHFIEVAHELVLHEERQRPARWQWSGARELPIWFHQGLVIVEMCSEAELYEESDAMHHCVWQYGLNAALGQVRLFSVRDSNGARLSTLSVTYARGRWLEDQHFSHRNQDPPAEAVRAVAAFLKDEGGWHPGRLDALDEALTYHQAHPPGYNPRVYAEFERRFPARPIERLRKAPMGAGPRMRMHIRPA